MARRILVVPATHGAGVTAACLGLVHELQDRRVAVGFAKPFEQVHSHDTDQSTELFRLTMALRPPQPISAADLARGLALGDLLDTMGEAVELTAELDAANRVLVLEGLAPTAEQPAAERIDIELAQAFDAEVLLVGSAVGRSPEELADRMETMRRLYTVRGESRVVGVVVNRVADPADAPAYASALTSRGLPVAAVVPTRSDLTHRRVSDLVRELGLEVVRDGEQDRRVGSTAIIAQNAPHFLASLVPDRLLIFPGDRHEVIMGAALAEAGGTRLAAVLLTGGIEPDPDVLTLCEAAAPSRLPILSTPDRTFETAQRVLQLGSQVPGDDEDRARRLMEAFADCYDPDWVDGLPRRTRPARVTPAGFLRHSRARTAAGITRVAVSDGTDVRVLRAMGDLADSSHVRCVVVSRPDDVEEALRSADLTLPAGTHIVDPEAEDPRLDGILDRIRGQAQFEPPDHDPFVRALALQAAGVVDGVVGGIDLDRATAVRAIEAFVEKRSDVASVSASQFVQLPDEVLLHADTVLVGEPTAEQLACIAQQTAATAELFGLEPRIAFVRPSSSSPHAAEQRDRITRAMELLSERRPDLHMHGPVAYRTATSRVPDASEDGRNATVLVFPEIASATATVRAAAGSIGTRVHPPLLQGLSRAVNILPSSGLVWDVEQVIRGTAVQAGYMS